MLLSALFLQFRIQGSLSVVPRDWNEVCQLSNEEALDLLRPFEDGNTKKSIEFFALFRDDKVNAREKREAAWSKDPKTITKKKVQKPKISKKKLRLDLIQEADKA